MKNFFSILIAGLVCFWVGGGIWFIASMPIASSSPKEITDAIIILTGGADRVEAALDLLLQGTGKKLLISGVYRHTTLKDIIKMTSNQHILEMISDIDLDYVSKTTCDNARQSAQWMKNHQFQSLRLVTANYHMRRALLEFKQILPGLRIVDHPIVPKALQKIGWYWDITNLSLIGREYHKYIGALARFYYNTLLHISRI